MLPEGLQGLMISWTLTRPHALTALETGRSSSSLTLREESIPSEETAVGLPACLTFSLGVKVRLYGFISKILEPSTVASSLWGWRSSSFRSASGRFLATGRLEVMLPWQG